MPTAFGVFLNGISGVFIGLAVLYGAIKVNKFVARRTQAKAEE